MAILFALAAALLWGSGDFAGGTASRRWSAITVVTVSQLCGLATVAAYAMVAVPLPADLSYFWWAAGAAVTGTAGLVAFYRALAIGTMGVVSPISALGVMVPVIWGLFTGSWPTLLVGIGMALAIIGTVTVSGPERGSGAGIRSVALAIFAAVFLGSSLIFLAGGGAVDPVYTTIAMRCVSIPLLTLLLIAQMVRRRRWASSRHNYDVSQRSSGRLGTFVLVAAAGIFDTLANVVFAAASTMGALAIVAILGSLYPVVTVLLARIIHGEQLKRIQHMGVVIALAGIALITTAG